MTNYYYPGQRVTVSAVFLSTANEYVDPTWVQVRWRTPQTAYYSATYGVDAALVRVATGRYYASIDIPTASAGAIGTWHYAARGTGNVYMASADMFTVINDGFV